MGQHLPVHVVCLSNVAAVQERPGDVLWPHQCIGYPPLCAGDTASASGERSQQANDDLGGVRQITLVLEPHPKQRLDRRSINESSSIRRLRAIRMEQQSRQPVRRARLVNRENGLGVRFRQSYAAHLQSGL